MYRTSSNTVPGRKCSDCRCLTAICLGSTGSWTSRGACETLRGFTILASMLCVGCAGRIQILWDKLIFRHTGMWRQLLKSGPDCCACQRKQNNTRQSQMSLMSRYKTLSAENQLIFENLPHWGKWQHPSSFQPSFKLLTVQDVKSWF